MTYVLSDIHGRIRPYHRMLKRIGFRRSDTLYILGDVIDRNPSGITILKEIMEAPNIHMLLGNHEYMMLDFLDADPDTDFDGWIRKMDRWCNLNGGWVTYYAFLRESQRTKDRILNYLRELPENMEINVNGKRILLVHASPTFLFSEGAAGLKNKTEFAVWNRIAPGSGVEFPQDLMVCGHTPTEYLSGIIPMEILQDGKIMWIDCGCAYGTGQGGRLACVRLETGERFYESAG
ncbi:MAG: metallophosphoesterase [Oscillospiraceae bacterium]|nr:metallophosphoesterase [Oscillospiraceae bacterium]